MKDYALARVEICRRNAEGNAKLFKGLALKGAREECDHAIGRGKAAARKSPARERGEARVVREIMHLSQREPTAVARADQRADAGTCDDANRNTFFFQNFENTDMSDPAGEPSA